MAWAPDYVTATELKDYLRIGDTDDDTEIGFAITAASRAVDHAANRQFGVTTLEARVYTPRYDKRRGRWTIEFDDVQNITGLLIDSDDDDDGVFDKSIDDFRLIPFNAVDLSRPYEGVVVRPESSNLPVAAEGSVQVTALFGWTAVPSVVKQATLLQASRFFNRRNAPFGVAGSPDIGSELRLLQRVDVDVAVMLRPYIRWWGAA